MDEEGCRRLFHSDLDVFDISRVRAGQRWNAYGRTGRADVEPVCIDVVMSGAYGRRYGTAFKQAIGASQRCLVGSVLCLAALSISEPAVHGQANEAEEDGEQQCRHYEYLPALCMEPR